jgi:hypothetical protein
MNISCQLSVTENVTFLSIAVIFWRLGLRKEHHTLFHGSLVMIFILLVDNVIMTTDITVSQQKLAYIVTSGCYVFQDHCIRHKNGTGSISLCTFFIELKCQIHSHA